MLSKRSIAVVLLLALGRAHAMEVGDLVCVQGYVMDKFCIDLTYLLDKGSNFPTLEVPEEHSVHCLVDVDFCVSTPFEVLEDRGPGETMHRRAYRLDDSTKALAVALARDIGTRCSTCDGDGNLVKGFRIGVMATVTALASGDTPPTVTANGEVVYSPLENDFCALQVASPTTNPTPSPSRMPTRAPVRSPTSNPIPSPSRMPTRAPVRSPTSSPIRNPSNGPTVTAIPPTGAPTLVPTLTKTSVPTFGPTATAESPTIGPTGPAPTVPESPTSGPSSTQTKNPTSMPSRVVSSPTMGPDPSTASPTAESTSFQTTTSTTSTSSGSSLFASISYAVAASCLLVLWR